MDASAHKLSMFSQGLDRVAFVAYLLGAVVPLVALGSMIERYKLAASPGSHSTLQLLGLVASIGMLSLGCFFMLRRIVRRAINRMDEDNLRLGGLLSASRSLANAHHETDAGQSTVHSALALTKAHAACVLLRSRGDGSLKMSAAAGANQAELYESLVEPLTGLADLVMREGRPVIRGPGSGGGEQADSVIGCAVAIPLPGEKAPLGALAVIHTDPHASFDAAQVDALTTLAGLASVALINAELRFAQRNFFSHVTDILVTAVDVHLDYHKGHGRRVAHLANQVGRSMRLDEERLQRLHFAALLHDIGMLKIDRSIRHNRKTCQKHPVFGWRMLSGIRLWDDVAPLVLHHHERFDGSGYPEGLAGDAIPLESRIIGLCEAFDTMTASTSYKVPVPFRSAVEEIKSGSGTHFDPAVVRVFLDLFEGGTIDVG